MITKFQNFLKRLLIAAIVLGLLAIAAILFGSHCHAETYILTGADSTDKVFDAWIKGGQHPSYKTKNYGGHAAMMVSWVYSGNPFYEYGLVDFDISGFPASISEVDSAFLWGIANDMRSTFIVNERDTVGYDSISVEINQILVQWGEGVGSGDDATSGECSYLDSTANTDWNSEGCNGANTDIDATPTGWQLLELDPGVGNYTDTLYIDVTDDVKDMLADPVHPNEYAGWKITPVGFNQDASHISSFVNFFSKEAAEIHDPNKWQLLIYCTPVAAGQVILW